MIPSRCTFWIYLLLPFIYDSFMNANRWRAHWAQLRLTLSPRRRFFCVPPDWCEFMESKQAALHISHHHSSRIYTSFVATIIACKWWFGLGRTRRADEHKADPLARWLSLSAPSRHGKLRKSLNAIVCCHAWARCVLCSFNEKAYKMWKFIQHSPFHHHHSTRLSIVLSGEPTRGGSAAAFSFLLCEFSHSPFPFHFFDSNFHLQTNFHNNFFVGIVSAFLLRFELVVVVAR